jgi:NAD(P)-dependent dehydrogenase (short-subunit alcohol dehydrogenase family)
MANSDLFDLSGKVALITGSTKGIGRAIAEAMARHGARVVISSRRADACQAVAAELNEELADAPGEAIGTHTAPRPELERLVETTRQRLGPIDVLVLNAAVNPYYGPSKDIPDSAFDKVMSVNIRSNHWLAHLVLPDMVERRDGVVIVISSIGGLRGSTDLGAYAISKAADLQLVRNLAAEYGRHNVRVNAISPGLIRTDFARALWENPDNLRTRTARDPLRRIGEPEEIAGCAVFLAARAGSFATGQNFIIDGGATIT